MLDSLKRCCIGLFCLMSGWLLAQDQPGGVAQPIYWYKGSINDQSQTLNFNLSNPHPLAADDANSIKLSQLKSSQELSIFTIYYPAPSQEEMAIWHLKNGPKTSLVLTTHRMADLLNRKYINYDHLASWQPRLHSYIQHKITTSPNRTEYTLVLGSQPQDHNLPLKSYRGLLPEIIVFDRVLSPVERLQVSSYLAIKYGISLAESDQSAYLNATADTIWHGHHNQDFSYRITGLGKDARAGLKQTKSSSSYDPYLLTIAWEQPDEISDPNYLIWGDNDEILDWEDNTDEVKKLKRQWLMETSGSQSSTRLRFNTKQLRRPVKDGETYWLLIDRSGRASFTPALTDYIPLDHLDEDGFAYFKQIDWDLDGSGTDNFSLGIGPCPDCDWAEGITSEDLLGPFLKVDLSPNPSPDGQFNLQILLEEERTVQLRIFNASGQKVIDSILRGRDFYQYQGQLVQKGSYFIELQAGKNLISRQLLVQ